MKAKVFKVGKYEVICVLYDKNESTLGSMFYAKRDDVPELMFIQGGNKKDFNNFNNEIAENLINTYSESIDLKANTMDYLYNTNERVHMMNAEIKVQEKGEVMY